MRGSVAASVPVERDIEEQLAAGRLDHWHGRADALAYSFTWHHSSVGLLEGHVHAGMELGMVLTGGLRMHFADVELECKPGDIWLCGMWEPHAWRVTRVGTTNIALIFLPDLFNEQSGGDPPYLELFALPPDCRPRVPDSELRERFLAIGRNIYREKEEKRPFWRTSIRLDLLRILIELSRVCDASLLSGRQPVPHTSRSDLARIMPAVNLVHERPWCRVTAAAAAAACTLSRSRFHHVFRRAMGISFGRFCLRIRLAFTAHRLLHTDHTVEAIAHEAGFVDTSHLCRTFVKHYARTPHEYRQQEKHQKPQ